jgi:uncharacterized phage-associated protein
MITPLCKKSVQAINYFARKKEGHINKMKAIKLIYFADRYHIRKYGRPVVGDVYWAMKLGPVASCTLNTANLSETSLEKDCLSYAKIFLSHPKGDVKMESIISKEGVDLKIFSQTDIEALETSFKEFGDKDQFELADLSHLYPEWFKHKKEIEIDKKRRVRMDYLDFFSNPRADGSSIFNLPQEHLDLAKNTYLENQEAERILA